MEVCELCSWEGSSLDKSVCLSCSTEPGVQFLTLPQLGMGMHACNPRTGEAAQRGSQVQGYPWLYIELEASLGSLRPCDKINKKKPVNSGPCLSKQRFLGTQPSYSRKGRMRFPSRVYEEKDFLV